MAISLASIRRVGGMLPPRVVIHGDRGLGKTTFGASAPSPIFLPTEEGLGQLDVPAFPILTDYTDVRSAISALIEDEHDYGTVVLDSLDWLEPLVWRYVSDRDGKKDVEDYGYGKGYLAAADEWRDLLGDLNVLREKRNMAVILICHSEIKQHVSPDADPYDRYQLKLHRKAGDVVQEWADAIMFASLKTLTKSVDGGFNKKITRAVSTGERVMKTDPHPAYVAKNRYGLPPELPLAWEAFASAMSGGT
jgi:hypothetical protein